ncbi:hypothetical protein ACQKP0_04310 [Heyndrickxia sp. NPDC080065]
MKIEGNEYVFEVPVHLFGNPEVKTRDIIWISLKGEVMMYHEE